MIEGGIKLEEKRIYSIRKLKNGVASVAIATAFLRSEQDKCPQMKFSWSTKWW